MRLIASIPLTRFWNRQLARRLLAFLHFDVVVVGQPQAQAGELFQVQTKRLSTPRQSTLTRMISVIPLASTTKTRLSSPVGSVGAGPSSVRRMWLSGSMTFLSLFEGDSLTSDSGKEHGVGNPRSRRRPGAAGPKILESHA